MIQCGSLGIPKGLKNAISISIAFCLDFLIRNENITSECHGQTLINECSISDRPSNFEVLSISLEFGLTPSGLFSLRLTFELSKSESLRDVSVTRIGDTFSYGFPQTALSRIGRCKMDDPNQVTHEDVL